MFCRSDFIQKDSSGTEQEVRKKDIEKGDHDMRRGRKEKILSASSSSFFIDASDDGTGQTSCPSPRAV